jgi:hypothetical protein
VESLKIFGKTIPAAALALLALAGVAMAGLLNFYGKAVGAATVSQSVQVSSDGTSWLTCTDVIGGDCTITDTFSPVAGDREFRTYYIKNDAAVSADVNIDDDSTPPEVDELGAAVVSTATTCDGSVSYTDIKGGAGPLSVSIGSGDTNKICVKVKFKINTMAGSYTITTTVAPG